MIAQELPSGPRWRLDRYRGASLRHLGVHQWQESEVLRRQEGEAKRRIPPSEIGEFSQVLYFFATVSGTHELSEISSRVLRESWVH